MRACSRLFGVVAIVAGALGLFSPAPAVAKPAVFTNAFIVRLIQYRVPPAEIVEDIRKNPGCYALSPDDLAGLKREGVSSEIIEAMQKKEHDPAACAAAEKKAAAGASGAAPAPAKAQPERPAASGKRDWAMETATDPLTGETHLEARMPQRLPSGDEVLLTAVCDYDPRIEGARAEGPGIAVTYWIDPNRKARHRLRWTQPQLVADGFHKPYWAFGHAVPYTTLRVRMNGSTSPATFEQRNPSAVTLRLHALAQTFPDIATEFVFEEGDGFVVAFTPRDPGFSELVLACYRQESARYPARTKDWATVMGFIGPLRDMRARRAAASSGGPGAGAAEPPPDGFVLRPAPKSIQCTPATLAARLPDLVGQRGLDPGAYAKELAFVGEAVRTCAAVTPAIASKAPLRSGGDQLDWEDLAQVEAKYAICAARALQDASSLVHSDNRRHLWVDIAPLGLPPLWRAGQGFRVRVGFDALKTDPDVAQEELADRYTAAIAEIGPKR